MAAAVVNKITINRINQYYREAQAAEPSPEDGAASDRSSAGNGGATPTTQSAIDVASGLRLPLGEAAVFAIHGAFGICKVHQSNVATGRRQQSLQSPSLSEETSSSTEAEHQGQGQGRSLTVATANASSVLTTAKPSPSCATDAERLRGALRAARYGLNLLTLGQLEIAALGDLLRDVDLVIQMLLSLTDGADADETKQIFAQVEQTIFAGLQELVDEHLLPRLKGSEGDRNILELEVVGGSTTRSRAEHALPSKRPMTSADKTMTNSSNTGTTPGHAANPDSLVPPRIGFGTWRLNGTACEEAVYAALHHAHVRHLDTAESYGNLRCLRKAIGRSGIARAELYITTKISHFSSFHTVFYEIRRQLKILGTNYFDLVLLHRYPYGDPAALESAWRGLQELVVERGMARSVGVSNFGFAELEHLERFLSAEEEIEKQKESAGVAPRREKSTSCYAAQEQRSRPHPVLRPSVIQNKFSVYSPGQNEVALDRDFLAHVQARYGKQAFVGFSQLFANEDLGHFLSPVRDPLVITLADALSCSPAQLLHAFSLEKHVGVIPQSRSLGRIAENAVDVARTNFAELPPRVKYFLERISGTGLAHNRDVMRRHLMGTYSTLKFWGQPQTLANAGALHSVYGAGGQFQYKILGEGVEGVLDSVFGDRANGGEENEFLGSSPSAAYVAGWRWRYVLSHEPRDGASGTGMKRSKAFNYYLLTPRDAVALLIMGMADTLDQANGRCGWCEWLRPFNELSGDWPGNSKPPLHLASGGPGAPPPAQPTPVTGLDQPPQMISLEDTRQQVQTTTDTMRQNMRDMVLRDGQLRGLDNKSATLNTTAGQFSQSSRQLHQKMVVRQYFFYFVLGLLFVDAICYLIFPEYYWTATFFLVLSGGLGYYCVEKWQKGLGVASAGGNQGSAYVEFADDQGAVPMGREGV
eukprot:g13812.t1